MGKINEVEKWRIEIDLAEKFRKENFGEYTTKDILLAGENIEYFDNGLYLLNASVDKDFITTLNIVHAIVKNVVPSLWYQNPKILCFPKKIDSQDTAPIWAEVLNYYYKKCKFDNINKKIVWDAYVLGHGYYEIGYATKFGVDIEDDTKKKKSFIDRSLESLGLKKKDEEELVYPETDYRIVSESPYISYVSPFDFIRDPRALTMEESGWVGRRLRKSLKSLKENKKYRNTNKLQGSDPDISQNDASSISQIELDDLKFVDVYKIQYRNGSKKYDLLIAKDGENHQELYHEETIYKIEGWQIGELSFNKHGHKPFAKSDITKIKLLQDRLTSTIDVILEQVDKFSPKLAYNGTDLTEMGKLSLISGGVGALIDCNKNPTEVFRELNLTQYKADLKALIDQIIDIITIQTGLTRTQLTGVATGNSATEATIAQGGQTIRISDMGQYVREFANEQATKLQQIVRQFVDLEELQLITGISGVNPETGFPEYKWITIDGERSEKMQVGDYEIDIEVGSTEKPDLAVVRKQFENLFSILSRTDVITLMQQQGTKVDLAELLRMYLRLFPEAVKDIGKVIQKINNTTTGLIPPEQDQGGGMTNGSQFNALEAQAGGQVPNLNNILSGAQNNT